jgi:hypothetical protein
LWPLVLFGGNQNSKWKGATAINNVGKGLTCVRPHSLTIHLISFPFFHSPLSLNRNKLGVAIVVEVHEFQGSLVGDFGAVYGLLPHDFLFSDRIRTSGFPPNIRSGHILRQSQGQDRTASVSMRTISLFRAAYFHGGELCAAEPFCRFFFLIGSSVITIQKSDNGPLQLHRTSVQARIRNKSECNSCLATPKQH